VLFRSTTNRDCRTGPAALQRPEAHSSSRLRVSAFGQLVLADLLGLDDDDATRRDGPERGVRVPMGAKGVQKLRLCSERGLIRICRRNRVLTLHTDDAEKLRG
jgi:hypothetical protein